MTTLLLSFTKDFTDIAVGRVVDRTAAEAQLPWLDTFSVFIVEKDDDLLGIAAFCPHDGMNTLGGAGLAAIYNAFAGDKVDGRFTNRTSGAKRTAKLLLEKFADAPILTDVRVEQKFVDLADPDVRSAFVDIGPPSNTFEPPASEEETVRASTKAKTKTKRVRKAPKEVVPGPFKPVKRGTRMERLVLALGDGQTSIVAIAKKVNGAVTATTKLMDSMVADHGIQYRTVEGIYMLDLPEDRTVEDCLEPAKPPAPPKVPGVTKAVAAMASAQAGELPAKPVITSETNKHHQKHLDALEVLARDGSWGAVEEYPAGGSNTYSKMVRHYKECLLAAHRARASQQQTAAE